MEYTHLIDSNCLIECQVKAFVFTFISKKMRDKAYCVDFCGLLICKHIGLCTIKSIGDKKNKINIGGKHHEKNCKIGRKDQHEKKGHGTVLQEDPWTQRPGCYRKLFL